MDKLKTNLSGFNLKKQEGKIVLIFTLSLILYIIFILFGDIKKIGKITTSFNWSILPILLVLTLCNYIVRAFRFDLYLRQLNIYISFKRAFAIFLAGLSMTVTPGKTGEIIKAYLLKKTENVSVAEILPLLIIERMTDGIAMIILGIGGIYFLQNSVRFFIGATIFVLAAITFFKSKKYILPFIIRLEKKFPKLKVLKFVEVFFSNSQKLVTLKSLSLGIFLGCIAWAFEGYALYLIIEQLKATSFLFGVSTALFIFSFSSIAGFFVLIPGGIGVAEGSITYFLTTFFHLALSQAVFISILFRCVTLWFGVYLGLSCLIMQLRSKK